MTVNFLLTLMMNERKIIMFIFRPAVKRIPTSDAVEILHRRYGNSLLRKFSLRQERIKLKKEKETYAEGFHDGYWAGRKSKERYPYL